MKKTHWIAIAVVLAMALVAFCSYRLGYHMAHVQKVEEMEKFCEAAISVALKSTKTYGETGDEAAYWKTVAALESYISVYEQLEKEYPEHAKVVAAGSRALKQLLSLMYSHKEICKEQWENIRWALSDQAMYPYGIWPGDMQTVWSIERCCRLIEAAG